MPEYMNIEVNPRCPDCDTELKVERLGDEPAPNDTVFCPACSFTSTRQTFLEKHFQIDAEEIRDTVGSHAEKLIREMLSGFKTK